MQTNEPTKRLPRCADGQSFAQRVKLLISVREPDEVEAAITGGADWIDLKEPLAGPLGAVSSDIGKKIIDQVGGRRPISAALGELDEWGDGKAHELLNFPEIEVVKLGLAGLSQRPNWQAQWKAAVDTITASGCELAAVAYADWRQADAPSPTEIIACAAAAGSRYFLIDTFNKKNGGLCTYLSVSELNDILGLAKDASLQTVVAGSIQPADLRVLSLTETDVIGVRGSVCGGDRTAKIDEQLVAGFRAAMFVSVSD